MPVPLPAEPIATRSGTWALRFGLLCIVVATLPFVWQGIAGWRDDDRLRSVVVDFFQSLSEGRRDAAARHLSPELQQRLLHSEHVAGLVTQDVRIQIISVKQDLNQAQVQATIGKQGFSLKPTVHLRRDAASTWMITEIDSVEVDPRWTKMREREHQAADEELAGELAKKLHTEE